MKRLVKQKRGAVRNGMRRIFLVVSTCFFLGGLLGILTVNLASGGGEEALHQYIEGFIAAVKEQRIQAPGLFMTGLSVLRWPLLSLLFSFFAVGAIGIPILFFVRGFLFSFCVAAFIRVMGYSGVLPCMILIGAKSLLTIPVLFVLGVQGIAFAAERQEKGRLRAGKCYYFSGSSAFLLPNLVCLMALLLAILWEAAVVPVLLSGARGLF